jgi:hypothetical protein
MTQFAFQLEPSLIVRAAQDTRFPKERYPPPMSEDEKRNLGANVLAHYAPSGARPRLRTQIFLSSPKPEGD